MDKTTEVTGELMDWLKTSAEKGGDFLTEQAPLYAQEVVAWEFWSSVTMAVFFLVALISSAVVARFSYKAFINDKSQYGPHPAPILCGVVSATGLLIFSTLVFQATYFAVKAAVAPRMVIIEHVRGLAK